ncbi:Stage III sporulation protein AF [compost metagenome]
MSLFILLTLLSPVMLLFDKKLRIDELLGAAELKQQTDSVQLVSGRNGQRMKSLEAIVQEADKLKASGLKQSQQLVETQIADLIKQDIQKQTELQVEAVQVQAAIDNNGKPSISNVRVTLHVIEKKELNKLSEGRSIAVMEPIKPIEPVVINEKQEQRAVSSMMDESYGKLSSLHEQEIAMLKLSISKDWQVVQTKIDIHLSNRQDGRTEKR